MLFRKSYTEIVFFRRVQVYQTNWCKQFAETVRNSGKRNHQDWTFEDLNFVFFQNALNNPATHAAEGLHAV